jgi:ribonuclease BN (tRNA processing enzyme)
VVGCSGSMPGPESAASCYLVEHEGFRVVLDLGHGSLGSLQRYIGIGDIDAVVLSHLHADHWIDLTALYVGIRYGPYEIPGRVPVYAPSGAADRMADAYGMARSPGLHSTFDFRELPLTTKIGPFRVRTARMAHPIEAYAIRLDVPGGSIVYSGDTGPCAALAELADGADVLLAEASAVEGEDNPVDLHMTGKDAGAAAKAAGVGHLVVTHVPPWNDPHLALAEARSAFKGAASLAVPGWALDVGR